jgi:hypothetical protein
MTEQLIFIGQVVITNRLDNLFFLIDKSYNNENYGVIFPTTKNLLAGRYHFLATIVGICHFLYFILIRGNFMRETWMLMWRPEFHIQS